MFKVLWFLKRIPSITHEQFREHYESSHVVMAQKYIGHLLTEYKRNYTAETWSGGCPTTGGGNFGPVEREWDCITEWVMKDASAFDEINAIFADPIIGREFHDDEENFLHRESVTLVKGDFVDTGCGDGHGTLRLTRKIGELA